MAGAKEDFTRFLEIGKDLQLEGDELKSFVDSAMGRKGHKQVTSWTDAEGGDDSGDFFSKGTKKSGNSGGGVNSYG